MARGFRGVKDDLSEIGRHLLDIACFLAPLIATTYTDSPPSSPHTPPQSPPPTNNTSRVIAGAINDLAEIGGGLRSGISRFSSVLKRDRGRDLRGVGVAVREEVLGFVRDLVKCPESWVEFPVPVDDCFDMSHHQREHISTVECLAPSLAALRVSLCPIYMNEESFWKIYFALLHPRLNKHESEFLSTQQIVEEMRTNLKKKMQNRLNTESQNPVAESSSSVMSDKVSDVRAEDNQAHVAPTVTETTSLQYIDRWFDMPAAIPREMDASTDPRKQFRSKEEIYYSEAEDDDNIILLKKYASSRWVDAAGQVSSPHSSIEHLQLRKKSDSCDTLQDKELVDEETSDWHAVDDFNFEIVERS